MRRRVLATLLLEKTGSGLWQTAAVLYLTEVVGLRTTQVGLLLGVAGLAGICGSPLAAAFAQRVPTSRLCGLLYLLRAATTACVPFCHSFWTLLPALVLWALSDRGTAALQRLVVADAAGADRSDFQAVARVATNVGLAIGALGAAAVIAVGTVSAYRVLIVAEGLLFVAAALQALRMAGRGTAAAVDRTARYGVTAAPAETRGPWRDSGYLAFALCEFPLFLDNSILGVGLPLWIVHLNLPHVMVSVVFLCNTACVVAFQRRLAVFTQHLESTARVIAMAGLAFLVGCCSAAAAGTLSNEFAAGALLMCAAAGITAAEMMHTVTSWELAIALAPPQARSSYIGVQGIAQAAERAGGPVVLTGGVLAVGSPGWAVLGIALMSVALVQRKVVRTRIARHATPVEEPTPEVVH